MRAKGVAYLVITIVIATLLFSVVKWLILPVVGAEQAEGFFQGAMWLLAWVLERLVLWLLVLLLVALGLFMTIKPALDLRHRGKLRVFLFLGGLVVLYFSWFGLGEAWTSLFNTVVDAGA